MYIYHVSIHIYTHTHILPFIYRWTRVVTMSWLLWMMLHWTRWCSCLFKIMISFPSEKFLSSKWVSTTRLLNYMAVYFWFFWRTSMLFSISVTALIYIPTNNAPGFLLSTPLPLPTLVISYLSDNNNSNRCLTIKLSTPESLSLLTLSKISPPFIISQPLLIFCIVFGTITVILFFCYLAMFCSLHTYTEV